ncbi:MAG: DUF3488 domain-containing protein [Planctomycetales bacterium]|nr:DUF3488 domain-containing protein [Planctomycetales bacterium]
MKIQRYLQIVMALLVILGTWLLGMGQQSLLYPLAAVVIAVTSLIVVDFLQVFSLSRRLSAGLSIVACCVLLVQMIQNKEQSHLLNVANALILLEAILCFQSKNDRIYWELLALTLLQVIVAAALNLGVIFGFVLLVYVVVAILALALFYIHREVRSVQEIRNGTDSVTANGSDSFRWVRNEDAPMQVMNRSFFGRLATIFGVSILATVLMFFAFPRYSSTVWQRPDEQISTVGFSEEVKLEDIGQILESPEEVMRVEFLQPDGRPFMVSGEPYFRGAVLWAYNHHVHSWRQQTSSNSAEVFRNHRSPDISRTIRQKTKLFSVSRKVMFHTSPAYWNQGTPDKVKYHAEQFELLLDENIIDSQRDFIRYELDTTAFQSTGRQLDVLPAERGIGNSALQSLLSPWAPARTEDDVDSQFIQEMATQILAAEQLQNADAFQRAKALEQHFLNSGLYTYSLERAKTRNRSVNPMADFLQNHRTGHCQFFAGALALMLRSQGIPARLVVGYKGGEFNPVGSYYVVRQLHAHAWVEAYVSDNEWAANAKPGDLARSGNGAWLRLDPTPYDETVDADFSRVPWYTRAKQAIDYCQVLWDDYVLGLNSTRQRQAVYLPILRAFYNLFSREAWSDWFAKIGHSLMTGEWITWPTGLFLALFGMSVFLFRKLIYESAQSLKRRLLGGRRRKRNRSEPAFVLWDDLENLLARSGLDRRPEQTSCEFASLASARLSENPDTFPFAQLPLQLADVFNRVRFGLRTLAAHEATAMQTELAKMSAVLQKKRWDQNGKSDAAAETEARLV